MIFNKRKSAVGHKWRLIGIASQLFLHFLFLFSRARLMGYRPVADLINSRKFIFVCWHSRLLLLCYAYRKLNASIMVSNSADGEIVAQLLHRQGHSTVRGSTGKGGLRALKKQINQMRENRQPGVVVPDGPQGPCHKVQRGVILLSQKTGAPIIPLAYSSKRRKVLNSWDRFIIPLPWSRAIIVHGNPIQVPVDADEPGIETYIKIVEDELNRITKLADHFFGHEFVA